jgi:hypothetical protein
LRNCYLRIDIGGICMCGLPVPHNAISIENAVRGIQR